MSAIVMGDKEFFKRIPAIKFEGTGSDNPLAYRWYDENKLVAGKPMKDHLRFAVAYWHSFVGNGSDQFGEPTHIFSWNEKSDPIERAKDKAGVLVAVATEVVNNGERVPALNDVTVPVPAALRLNVQMGILLIT